MTERGKLYWLRKPGTKGMAGSPNGLLAVRDSRGRPIWTQKPGIANVYHGGDGPNEFLAQTNWEPVEVVRRGTKRYHRRLVGDYVPVKK